MSSTVSASIFFQSIGCVQDVVVFLCGILEDCEEVLTIGSELVITVFEHVKLCCDFTAEQPRLDGLNYAEVLRIR